MYKFQPILKSLIWGGEKIAPYKGIATDQRNIGESWELSGVKDNESVVAEGPEAGTSLPELIARHGAALLGKANYGRFGEEFPLLIKFIDARQDLSIQVHPNDELAWERHKSKGKTEMWYVVSADKDAHLRSGFSKQVTPAEYNRRDANGNTRELHTELAKGAIDYTVLPDYRTHYEPAQDTRVELVSCPYFTTSLYDLTRPETLDLASLDSFVVAICIEGCGTLTDDSGAAVPVHQGETVLIPASARSLAFTPDGGMKILTSWIG